MEKHYFSLHRLSYIMTPYFEQSNRLFESIFYVKLENNMKFTPTRLTFGAKINRAVRYLLRLCIYLVLGLALLALPIFGYYVQQADQEVTPQFKNRSWAQPARVYARPLEVFEGARVSLKDVEKELDDILYRPEKRLNQPGTYRIRDNELDVFTRHFSYSDGFEPSQKVTITFNKEKNRITGVKNSESNDAIALLRIEPMIIASIYPAHNEDRILLKREEIPQILIDSLIAMEDRQFYSHHGINPKAIIRAMIANAKAGHTVQGGSTLTQQLIKNYFLTSEQTLDRKIKEMFYSIVLDWRFDKDEIIEAYINEIYLAQDGDRAIHGFGLASEFFFGKPIADLTLSEIATLVGVIPSPTRYNPRRNPETALKRRNLVIDVLVEQNLISQEDGEIVKASPLDIIKKPVSSNTKYPAYIDVVFKELKSLYSNDDLTSGGLKIFTSFDPTIQEYAEKALIDTLPVLEKEKRHPEGTLQGALVIAKNQTGEIAAIVGDRNPREVGFNRAVQAQRQIGSLIKPFVYLKALEEPTRFSLTTFLDDETPLEIRDNGKVWAPNNVDRRLHGWVPLMTALAKSYNIPTVRLGMSVGEENVVDLLYRMGIDPAKPISAVPALSLGSVEMSPLEVSQIYSTLANMGYRMPLNTIREVTTMDGRTLARNEVAPSQAADSAASYLINTAMMEIPDSGTAGRVRWQHGIKTKLGAKTGTTNGYRDSWFAGFTGNYTTVAWVGRDDNKPTGLTGSSGALNLWANVMKKLPLTDLALPQLNDIVVKRVDLSTGLLPPAVPCESSVIRSVPYIKGYEPTISTECYDPSFNDDYDDFEIIWD